MIPPKLCVPSPSEVKNIAVSAAATIFDDLKFHPDDAEALAILKAGVADALRRLQELYQGGEMWREYKLRGVDPNE